MKVKAHQMARSAGDKWRRTEHGDRRKAVRRSTKKQKFQSLIERTDKFLVTKLLLPRYIDLEDQQLCSIFPRLIKILKFQGWTGFVSEYHVYYPQLVLEFFQNLETNEKKTKL